MVKNYNILFYIRRDKTDSTGKAPIYCRITINGQRAELAIKQFTLVDKWQPGVETVKGSSEATKIINSNIDTVRTKINNHYQKMEAAEIEITAQGLRDAYLGLNKQRRDLIKVFEEHNRKVTSLVNKGYAPGTAERYNVTLKHLKEFAKQKYDADSFDIKSVDHEFITEFDYYLRSVRGCNNNSTVKYIKNFKKIIREALAKGWIEKDPFINYKTKLDKVDRGYLTQAELDALETKTFRIARLEQIKDIFLFQCYSGLAYIDAKALRPEHLKVDESGALWLHIKRQKTGVQVNIPLLDKAVAILNKYKDHPECLVKGVLLPVLSNQRFNGYLKEIGDLCGIEKPLTTHLARHSAATTVMLANGMSLESVSACLGHSNLKTTKIYAKMLDSRVADEMQNLNTKLNQKASKIM